MATPRRRGHLTVWRFTSRLLGLVLLLLAVIIAALLTGVQPVSLLAALDPTTLDHTLVFGVRLPRVFLGVLVGGALSGAGVTLQAILRNPLADPFVLGVSGGAALGATLALVAGAALSALLGVEAASAGFLGGVPVPVAASLGALATVALTLAVARSGGTLDPQALLLAGIVFNAFAMAMILFLRTLVSPDQAHALLPWLVGSLGHRPWPHLWIAAVVVLAGSLFLLRQSVRLNLLAVGEESAASLGVDVERTRIALVIVVSVMVGASVSLAGLVGFVGLVVPHLLRLLLGPEHRLLVPASVIGGGAFLVACDLLARLAFLPVGTELPVGVVTALLGAPLFLVLLKQSTARRSP
jgi:iron complex transport system permease protein